MNEFIPEDFEEIGSQIKILVWLSDVTLAKLFIACKLKYLNFLYFFKAKQRSETHVNW